MFLAIAVDNLATAQELTRDEESEMRKRDQVKIVRRRKLLMKEDKWRKVRAVPKILTLRKKTDNKDNPFSGITYTGRPNKSTGYNFVFVVYTWLAELPSVARGLNGLSVDAVYLILLLYPPVPSLSCRNLRVGFLLCPWYTDSCWIQYVKVTFRPVWRDHDRA